MRRKKTLKISEILSEYRKEMNIDIHLKEIGIANSWEEIAGRAIARRTSNVYVKENKLFITLSSSVVRNELMMMKSELMNRVNDFVGEKLINEIIIR